MVIVTISSGSLRGSKCCTVKGTEYCEFLGIPYAKPPVGKLRFKSPQPPESWIGTRDATTVCYNQVACQLDIIKKESIGTEDCLYLNVYTPKLPNDRTDLLPVMLFIHGGGFLHANGIIKKETGPDYLIDNNVVVITINYRLGIFGFLTLDIPEVAGNMGLKDQVQALKWVQNEIVKFGGDKNNVTIFGISAGSASAEYLILSPLAKNLFSKAILQSGSSLNHWAINYEPEKLLHQLLVKIGYKGSMQNKRAIHDYLINYPSGPLMEDSFEVIQNNITNRAFFGFTPTVERYFGNNEEFLTLHPFKILKDGTFNRVPVIKGFCEKEGHMAIFMKSEIINNLVKNKNFVDHWVYTMETNDLKKYNAKLSEVYQMSQLQTEEDERVGVDFISDFDFISGIWLSGQMMARHGVPIYFYKFSYDGDMNFFKNIFGITKKGASHADDFTYLFKCDDVSELANTCDIVVQNNMTRMWTNFAKTGNPTPVACDLTPWPSFTQDSPVYLNIEKVCMVEPGYEPNRMKIFKEIYDKYEK